MIIIANIYKIRIDTRLTCGLQKRRLLDSIFISVIANPSFHYNVIRKKMRPNISSHWLWLVSICILIGCGSSSSSNNTFVEPIEIMSITYEFDDIPLPAESHRSYVITATPQSARIVITAYDDSVLVDQTHIITSQQFTFVRNALDRNLIRNCELGEDDGCSGGSRESISYSDPEQEIFYGSVYHCNLKNTGNLCGNYLAFSSRMRQLIPEFWQLLELPSGT